MKEFDYINWIRGHRACESRNDIIVGPGDDCAVMAFDGQTLITTDQCLDGVHFILDKCGGRAAGRKVFARSLSDIAAMGGEPVAAVATAALPGDIPAGQMDAFQKELYAGLSELCDQYDCPIVGGDLSFAAPKLHFTVTMFGRAPVGGAILRSTARPGDLVVVTGSLGGAWQAGRDLTFRPRVAEAAALVANFRPTAMIDLSDGLSGDLVHICDESGVGAVIFAEKIPISADAARSTDPIAAALGDGEDYELLFTAPTEIAAALLSEPPFSTPVTVIGEIRTEAEGVVLQYSDGTVRDLRNSKSFEHGC